MIENTKQIASYKELIVWQKSVELVEHIYHLTKKFPKEEVYGLVSQMRRASVSIPSNIAEGRLRRSKKDFIQFLQIAFGSGAELETQIIISKKSKIGLMSLILSALMFGCRKPDLILRQGVLFITRKRRLLTYLPQGRFGIVSAAGRAGMS